MKDPVAPEPVEQTADSDPRRRTGFPLWRVVLGLLLVAAVATASVLAVLLHDQHASEDARAAALSQARADALAISTYDYRNLDAYFATIKRMATGSFASQYRRANADLRALLSKSTVVTKASLLDAGVETASDDRVVVLAFVDQTVSNATVGSATHQERMRLTMVRVRGKWLVSQLDLR